ncbi:hypothetical protein PFICI_06973 [Pestalotiopsis fici W106-1]|uniref:Uncharacterized protein n=1 Tax=Pestalotiopsis fici (strain W106-1 / CGMCC3.15140) TaxID=1229662 RepID=W3X9X2_PESFW|nr:uncharacterized protein PFICI_06973 [Pestalotiopsis fici W106-1]ETS81971.1 hypothetical protein PFICI_06973 [Pestalotiopsis fici W106-1]
MSMSGFSIRRLVSKRSEQRSSVDLRERECSGDEGFQDPSNPDSKDTRKESWFTTSRKQGKSWSSTSKFSFRPRSLPYNISSILLPLSSTETSASSSASSLCSCDRHGSPSLAGRSRSTLCSLGSRDESSELSLHASSTTSYDGNATSSPLSERDNDTDSTPTQSRLNSSRTNVDQIQESMPSSAEDKDKDTSRPGSSVLDATDTGVRHSVEEFIQEANKAFKIGNSFREVNATRTSFNETPRLPPAEANASAPRRRASVQRKPKKTYRFARSTATTPISPANSVRRKPSVKTVKRKKSTKARQPMKSHRKSLGPKPASKNNSKWTENMSDLLSGKLFQKIEADEMLTPAQLEAYKLRRLSKLQLAAREAAASETSLALETETVDTPVEPFHMDDLPSRIGSSGVKLTASTPIEERPDPAVLKGTAKNVIVTNENNNDELFLGQTKATGSRVLPSSDPAAKISTIQDDHPNQHSQTTSPSRYILRKIPELPTISENTTVRGDEELFLTHGPAKGRRSDSAASITTTTTTTLDPDYVYLRSTPYTLTAPRFRHGPIRLARADLCPEPQILGGEDGGLDWTAFQMAILGGAGDMYFFNNDNNERLARQHAADDADAICAWWDDWGFDDGYGALVASPSVDKDHHQHRNHYRSSSRLFPVSSSSRRPSDTTTSSSSSSSCDTSDSAGYSNPEDTQLYQDIGRDNPYSPKHKWETLRRKAVLEGRSMDLDVGDGTKNGRKGRRKHRNHKLSNNSSVGAKKKSGGGALDMRESLASMPQSPMLDLQVMTSDNGDVDIVPMGYNLSHDLGDFLSWGNENVHLGNVHYDDNFI